MSRPVSQEFEYPPVFRARADGQRENYGYSAPLDRRQLPSREYGYGIDIAGPNRNNASGTQMPPAPPTFSSPFNHNHQRPSSSPTNTISSHPATPIYLSSPSSEHGPRNAQQPSLTTNTVLAPPLLPASNSSPSRSTLWWGDLESWMDEEYARQVCTLMGWDPVNAKVPHPAVDPANPQQSAANNPGYCFLTFPSHAHAAAVLAQINNAGKSVAMPNSSRPFVLNWASSVPAPGESTSPITLAGAYPSATSPQPQYQKEYSIFVGDLAPETSNSDLVAVFRNPVLGLRNDREPKYIRPFLSCKSAKIMLDPVTGVSRGYGFVRFTDEADQQRALIEMHGLYCLSRPMRISPATAKHKNLPGGLSSSPFDVTQLTTSTLPIPDQKNQALTVALPLPPQTNSVSAPIAATTSNLSINSNNASASSSSMGGSNSSNSISSNAGSNSSSMTSAFGSAASSEDAINGQQNSLAQLPKQYASTGNEVAGPGSVNFSFGHEAQLRQAVQAHQTDPAPRFMAQDEHWKHQVQARAILGNLIGPNGEQLTSTDPYNTTVFVGGLSPLISEETLRTFFAPFGDIHYVKVPVGKHCGFVQFVRKVDAERAIEKMQGFPIGGSKIRLSWGRSQYKAAQAAAQAAQAALQTQASGQIGTLTQDQALSLLHKFASQNYRPEQSTAALATHLPEAGESDHSGGINYASMVANGGISPGMPREDAGGAYEGYISYLPRPEIHRTLSNFSPFSPDPNLIMPETNQRNLTYLNNYYSIQPHDLKAGSSSYGLGSGAKVSPSSSRPSSTAQYGRNDIPLSRPSSGQVGTDAAQYDAMYDLNNTLASLEIDRPWKSNNAHLSGGHSGQFHLSSSP